eukprot:scaffold7243_cov394-Prasinococcus_capsulatus_cf.AAC.4
MPGFTYSLRNASTSSCEACTLSQRGVVARSPPTTGVPCRAIRRQVATAFELARNIRLRMRIKAQPWSLPAFLQLSGEEGRAGVTLAHAAPAGRTLRPESGPAPPYIRRRPWPAGAHAAAPSGEAGAPG